MADAVAVPQTHSGNSSMGSCAAVAIVIVVVVILMCSCFRSSPIMRVGLKKVGEVAIKAGATVGIAPKKTKLQEEEEEEEEEAPMQVQAGEKEDSLKSSNEVNSDNLMVKSEHSAGIQNAALASHVPIFSRGLDEVEAVEDTMGMDRSGEVMGMFCGYENDKKNIVDALRTNGKHVGDISKVIDLLGVDTTHQKKLSQVFGEHMNVREYKFYDSKKHA